MANAVMAAESAKPAVIRGFGGVGVIAAPVLEDLRDATQETVALHVRAGTQRVCVGQLARPPAGPLRGPRRRGEPAAHRVDGQAAAGLQRGTGAHEIETRERAIP
jgi:DNA-binding IclR family transcriptional regulator